MPIPPIEQSRIEAKLDTGHLPPNAPVAMFAGFGHSEPCSACDDAIYPAQVEYNFHYGDGVVYRMHLGCADLWEAECHKRGYRRNAVAC